MKIKFLKVKCGDSIFISYHDAQNIARNIIIDTGHHRNNIYPIFKKEYDEIFRRNEKVDLLILTHRDDDHIGGFWKLFNSEKFDISSQIDTIWLNHSLPIPSKDSKISLRKAVDLKEILQKANKCPMYPVTTLSSPFNFYGVELIILSPDRSSYEKEAKNYQKEEIKRKIGKKGNDHTYGISEIEKRMLNFQENASDSNKSSIAFLLKYKNHKALYLADSHPSVIVSSLHKMGFSKKKKLEVDFVKVSHHGSKFNTSIELLSLIDSSKFIFTTNGKNADNLPDKESLVRILRNPERKSKQRIQLVFNHKDDVLSNLFAVDDEPFTQHNFDLILTPSEISLTYKF